MFLQKINCQYIIFHKYILKNIIAKKISSKKALMSHEFCLLLLVKFKNLK